MRITIVPLASGLLAVLLSGCPEGVCNSADPPAPTRAKLAHVDLDAPVISVGAELDGRLYRGLDFCLSAQLSYARPRTLPHPPYPRVYDTPLSPVRGQAKRRAPDRR